MSRVVAPARRPAAWPVVPGAEPFELPGRPDVGVVLVHGFTGAPAEMRPLGDALADSGIGSVGVRLRGHGTHPDDMTRYRFRDWTDDVDDGLRRVLARHERAVLVGLSMGGTLVLDAAARHADDPRVIGLVTIGAPLVLDDWRLRFVGPLSQVIKWQAWGRPAIKNQAAWGRHVGYRRFRTPAIRELLALMARARARLPTIHQPILAVHASIDTVVPPRNATIIYEGVSSRDRAMRLFDNCYHVITVDFPADQLNADVVRFVKRVAMPSEPARPRSDGLPAERREE